MNEEVRSSTHSCRKFKPLSIHTHPLMSGGYVSHWKLYNISLCFIILIRFQVGIQRNKKKKRKQRDKKNYGSETKKQNSKEQNIKALKKTKKQKQNNKKKSKYNKIININI